MKTLLITFLVLTIVLVTGAFIAGPQLRDGLSGLMPEPPSTEVRTELVSEGTLTESISAPGQIEPHTDVEIAAEVSARILELPFREGEEVRKSDIICRLDDRDLRAALVSAKAQRDGEQFRLRADQARLDGLVSNRGFADSELTRQQALFETGDISRRDLDAALERVQDLDATLESTKYSISVVESLLASAEADIDRAEDGLANTIIKSPMDGVITQLNVEVGEIVTGSTTNPGTRLMTIADLSRMIHRAEVAESDVARVEVGQRVKVHINAYPDDVFSGTVREIALQRAGNPDGTGYFETEVEIDLQGRLIRSGHVANSDIEIARHEGVVVPYQAIVVRDVEDLPADVQESEFIDETKRKASVVYRIIDDLAVCTPIKAGASDLTHRVILAGLSPGDEIIIGPYKVLESIKHDERLKREGEDDEDATGDEAGEEDAPHAIAGETSAPPATDEDGPDDPSAGAETESVAADGST